MGSCLTNANSPAQSVKLSSRDYHLIWTRCLRVQADSPWPVRRGQHPVFAQITKDIDSTFPQHPFFNDPNNKQTFERVLRGYALHLPRVGYTQGLNFLCGYFLLSGLGQEECLRTMVNLCVHPQLLLLGVYEDEFPLCRLYCEVFWKVLAVVAPKASLKLEAAGLPDEVWIFQWFISLFVYCFPLSYLMEMLNFVILKRFMAPVRLAVGLVQCLQPYLMQLPRGEDAILQCFQLLRSEQFCQHYIPLKSVLKAAERIKKGTILQAMSKIHSNNNFYKYYFLGTKEAQQQKHERFMMDLKAERKRFQQPEQLERYSRVDSSLRVIDYINETQNQRMSRVYSTTHREKHPPIFSKLSNKKYNSVDLGHPKK